MLNILPGTVVKFENSAELNAADGKINIKGTPDSLISFYDARITLPFATIEYYVDSYGNKWEFLKNKQYIIEYVRFHTPTARSTSATLPVYMYLQTSMSGTLE